MCSDLIIKHPINMPTKTNGFVSIICCFGITLFNLVYSIHNDANSITIIFLLIVTILILVCIMFMINEFRKIYHVSIFANRLEIGNKQIFAINIQKITVIEKTIEIYQYKNNRKMKNRLTIIRLKDIDGIKDLKEWCKRSKITITNNL